MEFFHFMRGFLSSGALGFHCTKNNMTFINLISCLSDKQVGKLLSTRFLNKMLCDHRRFCPICLIKYGYYKLLWQVKEIKICIEHKVPLIEYCMNCKREIPCLHTNSRVNYCPWCNHDLRSSIIETDFNNYDDQVLITNDWVSLLNLKQNQTNSYSPQEIAIKLLYIITGNAQYFRHDIINKNIFSNSLVQLLLQVARGTRHKSTQIHLSTIYNVTRFFKMPILNFLNLSVPLDFSNSIINKHETIRSTLSCFAPWCKNYNVFGSLKRTNTSIKTRKNGNKLKYYLYCDECGSEYALDYDTNKLIERGYFINTGWNKVLPLLHRGFNRKTISQRIGATEDIVRRCTLYFAANNVINKALLFDTFKFIPKDEETEWLINYINEGKNIKYAIHEFKWGYNEFLYHRYKKAAIIAQITRSTPNPIKKDNSGLKLKIIDVIDRLTQIGEKITIKNVSRGLGVCPETLRSWGLLDLIKKRKYEERNNNLLLKKQIFISIVDKLFEYLANKNIVLYSTDIYNVLGVKRTVLVRYYPDVTKYISVKMKNHKLSLKKILKDKGEVYYLSYTMIENNNFILADKFGLSIKEIENLKYIILGINNNLSINL